jgi:hypothetical protein
VLHSSPEDMSAAVLASRDANGLGQEERREPRALLVVSHARPEANVSPGVQAHAVGRESRVISVGDRGARLEDGHDRGAVIGREPKLVEPVDSVAALPGPTRTRPYGGATTRARPIREFSVEAPKRVDIRSLYRPETSPRSGSWISPG